MLTRYHNGARFYWVASFCLQLCFFLGPKYLGALSLEVMTIMAFWRTSHCRRPIKLAAVWSYMQVHQKSKIRYQNWFWLHGECLILWFDLRVFSGHQSILGHRLSRSWQWWLFYGPPIAKGPVNGCRAAIFASSQKSEVNFGVFVYVWDADLIYVFFFRTPNYLGAKSLVVMAMMAFWRTSHCKRSSKLSLERPYLRVFKNSK